MRRHSRIRSNSRSASPAASWSASSDVHPQDLGLERRHRPRQDPIPVAIDRVPHVVDHAQRDADLVGHVLRVQRRSGQRDRDRGQRNDDLRNRDGRNRMDATATDETAVTAAATGCVDRTHRVE